MNTQNTPLFGIVGGIGAYASLLLQQSILEKTTALHDRDYPNLLVHSEGLSGFDEDARLNDVSKARLKDIIATLKRSGCQKIWVACNSVHADKGSWWDEDVCVDWVKPFGQSFPEHTLVMGSVSTGESVLYARGKKPTKAMQQKMDACIGSIIRGEHVKNKTQVLNLWDDLLFDKEGVGNQPLVLACTELSVCAHMFGVAGLKTYDSLSFIADQILDAHAQKGST
jgi:aspartate/glutamate racemase